MQPGTKFKTGVILLIVSQLLGWGGMAFFGSLVLTTNKPVMYLFGVGLYAISWGMLGLCLLLADKEGIPPLCDLLKKLLISLPLRANGPKKDGNP
ncbi:MAG: hypothetical protein A2Y65_05480 [Deltaproteobacteria bacterium RBG_13_52_11]|nr:MAG: hypothetical protein A2Y65_05480 [Deltaproteobacteria bacterium RBG_13_52_11]